MNQSSPAATPLVDDHVADRLCAAVERVQSPVCVGLDPVLEKLPEPMRPTGDDPQSRVDAIESFCLGVLDSIVDHIAVVKFQSACFERHGSIGLETMARLIVAAKERGMLPILDAKRGDIGISASHYAVAGRMQGCDWITINGWLGSDGVEPFLADNGGAFVLVRTSNPSGEQIQNLKLEDGRTVSDAMADLVVEMGAGHIGESGYSSLGAVVGATHPAELSSLRERLSGCILLLPGYGAQGGTADGIRPCFDQNGLGALVTSSRGIIYSTSGGHGDWKKCVRESAAAFSEEIGRISGMRS